MVFKTVDEMPEAAVSRASMSWNKTGSWRSSTPVYKNIMPPCNHNCPAGEDIRGYIDLMKNSRVEDAFRLLTDSNPLPAVCGRVCYHPCQASCNRHSFDTELQVRLLEKFIGDWGIEKKIEFRRVESISKKVAVIGAGPAGLAAAFYLNRSGVAVTVFDENPLPGGILQYGIPSFRLDKLVLNKELDRVLRGVEFRANTRLGKEVDTGDLVEFDAIFLGTGAHMSKRLNIPGEDLPRVESGLDFLKRTNSGELDSMEGKEALVIGGGNTACDVARAAKRMGAMVRIMYRRTEREMPAFEEEINDLKAESVKMEFLAAPIRIEKDEDDRLKVVTVKMKQGEPDESGRARPVPIEGSEFEVTVDRVFAAIGEDADFSFFPDADKTSDGGIDFTNVDKRIRDRLFVGGDILPNPRTVPHAVGSGRLAAEKIMAMFEGREYRAVKNLVEVAGPEDINYIYFTKVNETKWKYRIAPGGNIPDAAAAVDEAGRCFSCGVCSKCDNCYNFCPDMAIVRTVDGYHVNLDYCKGCGICARECAGGSLRMEGGA